MYLTKESLYANPKSKFILIKDSLSASGVKVFKSVCKLFIREGVNLHFVYYESRSRNIQKNLHSNNITEIDFVSDPCGWNSNAGTAFNSRSVDFLKKEVSDFKGVVCIDSFSPLLFHNDVNTVYETIHKLLKDSSNMQLIALMHHDVHDSYENELLERLATTVLLVTPEEDKLLTTVKYTSGKVTNQLTEYNITNNFEFSTLRDLKITLPSVPSKKPDPTANLTFNLKLKDSEKEARSQLVLPYMQMQNNDAVVMDDDMYEEDDPDDDLDI